MEIIPAVTRQKAGINSGWVTGQRVSRQPNVHTLECEGKPETCAPDTELPLKIFYGFRVYDFKGQL